MKTNISALYHSYGNDNDLVLNVDDLLGIIHQMHAIANGWGMDFKPTEEKCACYIQWECSGPEVIK